MTVLKNCWKRRDQGNDDLRNKAHDPHDHCIFEVDKQIPVREKLSVISESDKIRADKSKAGTIVFKEAVVDRCDQRDQLEDDIYNKERNQKDQSPFVVFDCLFVVHILIHAITSAACLLMQSSQQIFTISFRKL